MTRDTLSWPRPFRSTSPIRFNTWMSHQTHQAFQLRCPLQTHRVRWSWPKISGSSIIPETTFAGWWFGTFFIFSYIGYIYILGITIPTDFHIFQRGGLKPLTSLGLVHPDKTIGATGSFHPFFRFPVTNKAPAPGGFCEV